jgi:ornithine decarboxylase
MTELNPDIGFDCASINEITSVLPLVPAESKIIYAQPCKKTQDIKLAAAYGIQETVVDSPEEVEKLAAAGWQGKCLVRLLVDDKGSKQPFGKKFGAPVQWLPEIYSAARYHGIRMTGFSFHVGSECLSPKQYHSAIKLCKTGAQMAALHSYNTETIDIGGGFLHKETDFQKTASVIRKSQDYFSKDTRWIAEPGRFLAAPTHTLFTTVIGKKRAYNLNNSKDSKDSSKYRITVDESVYGAFSNIPFDHQTPIFEHTHKTHNRTKVPLTIFGRTCDSGDTISQLTELEEPDVGDVLSVADMGAYTTVTASEFNGFPKAERIYIL